MARTRLERFFTSERPGAIVSGGATRASTRARTGEPAPTYVTIGRQIGCFHLIAFGWLLFRVQDMQNFLDYAKVFAQNKGLLK